MKMFKRLLNVSVHNAHVLHRAAAEAQAPVRGSGETLKNYLSEREKRHDQALTALLAEADAINQDVESRIRQEAEILLSHIEHYENEAHNILNSTVRAEEQTTLAELDEVWKRRVGDVHDFKKCMDRLEASRADGVKKLLKHYFKRLVDIGHQPPYVLFEEFEHKIYSANQQLLCNARAHVELRDQLVTQADRERLKGQAKIKELSLMSWQPKRVGRGRSRSASAHSASGDGEWQDTGRIDAHARTNSESSLCMHHPEIEDFGECITRLLEVYKGTVMSVFTGFRNKLHSLREGLARQPPPPTPPNDDLDDLTEIQKLIDRALMSANSSTDAAAPAAAHPRPPDIGDINHAHPECHNIHAAWQQNLQQLAERLRHTYRLLRDSGHLWDAHMLRAAHAQKLALVAVEDLITGHDALQLAAEIPLNIAIEQLRQASDPDKLDKQYELIQALLDATADLYKKHYELEMVQLNQFMDMLDIMTSTLLAEIQCFLDKYPRQHEEDTQQTPGEPYVKRYLPRALLQTEVQVIALLNWKNGLLESLEQSRQALPEELQKQGARWIEDRSAVLKMRYSMKMLSHEIRAERIKKDVLERRRDELLYHEERLCSHVQAVNDLIEELMTNASTFLDFNTPGLYPVWYWLKDIQNKFDEGPPNELKLLSYQQRLSRLRRSFETSLEGVAERYLMMIAYRLQEARIANVRFLTHLKLFSEGGQFSAPEAARFVSALLKTGDLVEGSVAKITEECNKCRAAFLQTASFRIQLLENVVNEAMSLFRRPRGPRDPRASRAAPAQPAKARKSVAKK